MPVDSNIYIIAVCVFLIIGLFIKYKLDWQRTISSIHLSRTNKQK